MQKPAHTITAQILSLAYKIITDLNPLKEKDFLKAQKMLMADLIEKPGFYRKQAVGLMDNLFLYLQKDHENLDLIKALL